MDGYGGGIYLANASATSLISANQIYSNTASSGYIGWGGGIFITNSLTTIEGNSLYGNIALNIITGTQSIRDNRLPLKPTKSTNPALPDIPPPLESEQSGGGGI